MFSLSQGLIATVVFTVAGAVMTVVGYRETVKVRKANVISAAVPSFISLLLGNMKTGMVLSKAIAIVAESTHFKYITPFLTAASERIKKGQSVGESLEMVAQELHNDLFDQVTSVISKVEETGGDITGILEKVSLYVEASVKATSRRSTDMASYAAVTFISFAVLLFTLLLAVVMIFPKLASASTVGVSAFGISAGGLNMITWAFFAVSVTYSVSNGLISGVFVNGSVRGGAFYAGLLTASTAILFFVLTGGKV
jgi:type II secretory pathway component PulF